MFGLRCMEAKTGEGMKMEKDVVRDGVDVMLVAGVKER